jgi:hypothetical protein
MDENEDVIFRFIGTFLFIIITAILTIVIAEITGSVSVGALLVTIWLTLLSLRGSFNRPT